MQQRMSNKVPVRDTRVKSLDATSLYVAEHVSALVARVLGEELSTWQNSLFPIIWRNYLKRQTEGRRLN